MIFDGCNDNYDDNFDDNDDKNDQKTYKYKFGVKNYQFQGLLHDKKRPKNSGRGLPPWYLGNA